MKRNLHKKILGAVLTVCMVVSPVFFSAGTSQAATFSQINQLSVFLKQAESRTCTLCSATMLVRRAAYLNGNANWDDITESAMKSTAWCSAGLNWYFTYADVTVKHIDFSGSESDLISILKVHPEGVVVYKQTSAQQHAILVTDYTNGNFYCADPANNIASGRIPITSASIKIEDANYLWYVTSEVASPTGSSAAVSTPAPTAKATAKPSTSTVESSESLGSTQTSQQNQPSTKVNTSTVKVPVPATLTVDNQKKKALTAAWSKVSGVSGYQVTYASSKKFTGSKTLTTQKKKSVVKKLKKGKAYYFKVRAYKAQDGEKDYSKYSATVKAKVKK